MTKEELTQLSNETVTLNNQLGSGGRLDFDWWRKLCDVRLPALVAKMKEATGATAKDTHAQVELGEDALDLLSCMQRYISPSIDARKLPTERSRERLREAVFATLGPLARLMSDPQFGAREHRQIEIEFDADGPTGLEREENEIALDQPYDPSKIRVDPKTFSLRQVIDMISDGDLDLAPDFQRSQVWKPKQKSLLIESLLLRIPLPAFYFLAERDGTLRVVDGLQRLSAVYDFVRGAPDEKGGFVLSDLEYLSHILHGKRFDGLDQVWKRRILQTQIFVNVIDPQTPERVKFDIFKRINTGGTPLNAQEMRHCMSGARSRLFLKACTASRYENPEDSPLPDSVLVAARDAAAALIDATSSSLIDHLRMGDREAVLRFCAFRLIYPSLDEYAPRTAFEAFLSAATRKLDDQLSDDELVTLARQLERGMRNAASIFGQHAFRKWTTWTTTQVAPINRALLESWAVVLSDYSLEQLTPYRAAIAQDAREAMTSDSAYIDAISAATGEHSKVKTRFQRASEIVKGALLQ